MQDQEVKVANRNPSQRKEFVFRTMKSPHSGMSMERNEEIVSSSSRWKPTEIQKKILEQLYEAGERNPSRHRVNDITKLLKVHGDVEAKNVFYWFQNSQSRKKGSQQKSLMQELSLNPKVNAGSSQPSIGFTPTTVPSDSAMVLEPSVGLTQFSFQELLYSEESPSSFGRENIPPMNLLYSEESPSSFGGENIPPMNLFVRKHLQSAEHGTVCHVDRASKKQKQENNSIQEHSINQKDITGSSKNPSCSYATNASSIGWAPALAMTPSSSQRRTNSTSHKKSETVLPFNLSVQPDLHSGAKQPLCEANCDMNFKNDLQNMVRRDGWLGPFTKCTLRPSGCDIMTGSEIQEAESKGQLLELFPLHSDKNIRSERSPDFCEGNRTDPQGSNVVIGSEGEENKNKRELLELLHLFPDGNLGSRSCWRPR